MLKYKPFAIEFEADNTVHRIRQCPSNVIGAFWEETKHEDYIGWWGGTVMAKDEEQAIELLLAEKAKRQCKL